MFIIYKITSNTTGKSYIGVTKQEVSRRWYQHQWFALNGKSHSHFHRAIRKYGSDDFTVEEIFYGFNDDDRVFVEKHFISFYNTLNEGYNQTEGGEDFTSSEYQRTIQKRRVADGTHPFLGGAIQRESMKRRWSRGEFRDNNKRRVEAGTHHFLGDSNPQRKLAAEGKHHNQKRPWLNTKQSDESLKAWKMADVLYQWFVQNRNKKRGGSYKSMQDAFGLKCSLQKMYYDYFMQGWVPSTDDEWVAFAKVVGGN